MSTQPRKRVRKESSGDILIEELLADDMAYDADVEAVYPDGFEEPESETEQIGTPKRKFASIDEDLAYRMRQLGSERSGTCSPFATTNTIRRGRKRHSLHEPTLQDKHSHSASLEVTEIHERARSNPSPPSKRRRKSRPNSSSRVSDRKANSIVQQDRDQNRDMQHLEDHDLDVMDMT